MRLWAIREFLFQGLCVLALCFPAAAQTNGPDTVKALLAGRYGKLWLAARGFGPGDAPAEYRKRLASVEVAGHGVPPEAYEALALALTSSEKQTAAEVAEAQRLLLLSAQSGNAASQFRAHLILAMVLARRNQLSEAITALPDGPAPAEAVPMLREVRAMLHSRRGDSPTADSMLVSYPMPMPAGPEWELVRVACYLAGRARYSNAWSSFNDDVLEYSVENQVLNRLGEVSTKPSADPEDVWSAIGNAFTNFDAHDSSDEGFKRLLPYLLNYSFSEHRMDLLAMLARISLRAGNATEAETYLNQADDQLFKNTADPMERVEGQVRLAERLEVPEDASLAIKKYRAAYETVLKLPESAKQLRLSFDIAHTLFRLYSAHGDIRSVAEVYKSALPVAIQLDERPGLAKGERFFEDRLELDQITALAVIPARRPEALERLAGTLMPKLDAIMPLSTVPEAKFWDAMEAAMDPGNSSTIESFLRRKASADIQENAFPVLGGLYLQKSDWPAAERSLQQALQTSLKRQGVCYPNQLSIWRDLALASQGAGHASNAESPQQEWIDCSSVMNRKSEALAEALTAYAQALVKPSAGLPNGDWFGAEYCLRRALYILSLQPTMRVRSLANAQLGLAALLLGQGRVEEGSAYTMQAAAELTGAAVTTPGYKVYAMEALRQLTLIRQPGPAVEEAAFNLIQHGSTTHAAAALQAFSERASLRDPGLAAAVQERLELQRQRQVLDVEYDLDFGKKSADTNTERRKLLIQKLASLDAGLGASAQKLDAFPTYADLVTGRVVPLGTVTCQGKGCLLRPTESLIAFAQAPDALYAMVLRPGFAKLLRLNLPEPLAADLTAKVQRSVSLQAPVPAYDFASAVELYRRVWLPLREELGTADHVLVVGDGPLGGLPLEVLAAHVPAASEPPMWLDDEVSLAYLPSVATLRALRLELKASAATRSILVLGPPNTSAPLQIRIGPGSFDPFAAKPSVKPCALGLPQLPPDVKQLSTVLAQKLRGDIPRDLFQDAAMTKTTLLNLNETKDLATYRTIAFLTHGLMSKELSADPGTEPALLFTPPADCAGQQDRNPALLTASEVSGLSLDADLILLIACNTAASDGTPGVEPLSGLARAFFFAGARSLLVSYWSVDSVATARLMALAFQQDDAVSRADQMRKARKQLRTTSDDGRSFAHPVFWGAFVTVGDGR